MQKLYILSLLLIFLPIISSAQINVQYIKGVKTIYTVGDTITIPVQIKAPPETCLDGMSHTKFFQKGISMAAVLIRTWTNTGR